MYSPKRKDAAFWIVTVRASLRVCPCIRARYAVEVAHVKAKVVRYLMP